MSIGNKIYANLGGDRVIWLVVVLLSIISLLAVYSATGTLAYRKQGGDTEFYLIKHFMLMSGGLGLMYVCYLIHYKRYSRWAPVVLLMAVPLLLYTLLFGTSLNEAARWITVPIINISFQSSDFAKLALIMYLAREIATKQDNIKDLSAFLPILLPVLVICGLIAPADLSTAILLFITCLLLMFIGRVNFQYIGLLILLGIVMFSFLIILAEFTPIVRLDTWVERTRDFVTNSEGAYQIQQAKIAIAEGGWFGTGPGNSVQRNYLPHAYSDFIYAIIVEEYGLFGGFLIITLYITLLLRCVRLVTLSPKAFGAMLALGLSLSLVLQALANMAVSVHLVPVTGLTLPLLSMGGTSLLFTSIAVGMVLSVSKYIEMVK